MAIVNLGSIKFNWQGAYNGATAYSVDDVVSYNGSSYVCTAASTGNLPTDTNFWDQMSSAGTDGTDLTTTLTTQGDLVYRDGSGLQRLGAGTAGQVLQTGGTGANPSWGTVSSDMVKLAGVDLSGSSATSYDFTQFMDDSVYRSYHINIISKLGVSGGALRMRFLNNTTPYTNSTEYRWGGYSSYARTDATEYTITTNNDADGRDYAQLHGWSSNNSYITYFDIKIYGKPTGTTDNVGWLGNSWGRDYSSPNYLFSDSTAGFLQNNGVVDGLRFYSSGSQTLNNTEFTIWGLKK